MQQTRDYVEAKPYIRIGLAILFRLCKPVWSRQNCLEEADEWLKELENS